MKFSIVILAQPNVVRLPNAIQSALRWSDDVVVVWDAEAVPNHIESQRPNVNITHKLISFAEQRNIGVNACKHEWILHVDSDEEVSDELGVHLRELDDGAYQAYGVPLRTYLWGRPVNHAFGREYHVRLHHRTMQWSGTIHEVVDVPSNRVGRLTYGLFLKHYTVDSLHQWMMKTSKYVEQEARHDVGASHRLKGPLRPLYRTTRVYLLNAGFMDGWMGIIVALLTLVYEVLVVIATWESRVGN